MTDFALETVAEIIGDEPRHEAPGAFTPAVLEGTPELPPPGLYFGMPEDVYHALPALSSHGIRKLAGSPMLFWASTPWLSEIGRKRHEERLKKAEEKQHLTIGKAYHCRIMEGPEAFAQRFAVDLTEEDCEGALESTDQIKAALGEAGEKPVAKVPDKLPSGEDYMRPAKKADWIAQLLDVDPEAKILDVLKAKHRETHDGKAFISREAYEQIEIAARMVESDPEIRHAFKDGYPEVTLIWTCPRTGVPMKARVDYLKLRACVDLKSIANQRDRSLENAIRFEIAGYHYNVQPSVYTEGVEAVRKLVLEHSSKVIHSCDLEEGTLEADAIDFARHKWAAKWASESELNFLLVFQQKGDAPVTRGCFFPIGGTTWMLTNDIVLRMKRKFREFSEVFGTDHWLDIKPIYDLADEDIPAGATEI